MKIFFRNFFSQAFVTCIFITSIPTTSQFNIHVRFTINTTVACRHSSKRRSPLKRFHTRTVNNAILFSVSIFRQTPMNIRDIRKPRTIAESIDTIQH